MPDIFHILQINLLSSLQPMLGVTMVTQQIQGTISSHMERGRPCCDSNIVHDHHEGPMLQVGIVRLRKGKGPAWVSHSIKEPGLRFAHLLVLPDFRRRQYG